MKMLMLMCLIESDIEKYRELEKVLIGKGEDNTTGSTGSLILIILINFIN